MSARTRVDRDAKEAKQAKHLISQPPPECQSFTRLAFLAPSPSSRQDAGEPNQVRMRGKWMQVEEKVERKNTLSCPEGVLMLTTCVVACLPKLAINLANWIKTGKRTHCGGEESCAVPVNHGGWRLVVLTARERHSRDNPQGTAFPLHRHDFLELARRRVPWPNLSLGLIEGCGIPERWCSLQLYNHAVMNAQSGY